jgi:hypothetical protein
MKRAIVFLLLLWTGTHCQHRNAENAPKLDAGRLTQLNGQLSEKALAPRVLVNKIEISCQHKARALGRDLTRLEYLSILRDEHLAALPEELQGQQVLDEMARLLRPDTLAQLFAAGPELAMPLPNINGPAWLSITREGLAESRRQGQAVLGWLEGEKLVDEAEREAISQTIEESTLLFPHQAYDLILRGLRTGSPAPGSP